MEGGGGRERGVSFHPPVRLDVEEEDPARRNGEEHRTVGSGLKIGGPPGHHAAVLAHKRDDGLVAHGLGQQESPLTSSGSGLVKKRYVFRPNPGFKAA